MLRALVIVVLLLACERKKHDEAPPPPVPSDAAKLDAHVDDADREARVAALERLYEFVTTTKRTRSPVEAPEQHTLGYVDYLFAYGFARLGEATRTRDVLASAKKRHAEVADDPVHAMLAAAYSAQVSRALAGKPPASALPSSVDAQLGMLDRVGRYKVDRLRESSKILNPSEAVDAIGAFSRQRKDGRGDDFERLRGVADPVERKKVLNRILYELTRTADGDRGALLAAVIDEASRLPAEHAKSVLDLAIDLGIELVPATDRVGPYVAAVALAKVVASTRVRDLAAALQTALAEAKYLDDTIDDLARILDKDLAELWTALEPRALGGKASPTTKAYFAAGLAKLGDPRGKALLRELEGTLDKLTTHSRLQVLRALVSGYQQLPRDDGHAAIERLARSQFPTITDSFGTNTHFSLNVVQLVDIAVLGVIGE